MIQPYFGLMKVRAVRSILQQNLIFKGVFDRLSKIWYLQPPKRKLGTPKKMGILSLDTTAAGAFPGGL